jgi:hypothetical protein
MTKIVITISVPQCQVIGVEPDSEETRELARTAEVLLQECQRFGDFYAKFAAYTIKNFGLFPAASYDGPSGRLTLLLHD